MKWTYERMLDNVAEAIWQAESQRSAGRPRSTQWRDESKETRAKYLFLAAAVMETVQEAVVAGCPIFPEAKV